MSFDWSKYKNAGRAAAPSAGRFINLKDGESVTFFVPGQEPGCEETYWANRQKVEPGTPGAEKSVKVVLSVWDTAAQCHRILRITPPSFDDLVGRMVRDGGDRPYTLTRTNTNGRIAYRLEKEDRLSPAELERIRREPLLQVLDLDGVYPMTASTSAAKTPPAPADAVPPRAPRPAKPSGFAMTSPDSEDPF